MDSKFFVLLSFFILCFFLKLFAHADEVMNPFLTNQIDIGFYNGEQVDFPHPPSPLFWTGHVDVTSGLMVQYERLIFHTMRYFSINVGASVARWKRYGEDIYVVSVYAVFQLWLYSGQFFNPYLFYSIAGPSVISRRTLGSAKLGENFIFQDFFGLGFEIGSRHALNLGVKLLHYSNGDLFYLNNGFDVPIVVFVGVSF